MLKRPKNVSYQTEQTWFMGVFLQLFIYSKGRCQKHPEGGWLNIVQPPLVKSLKFSSVLSAISQPFWAIDFRFWMEVWMNYWTYKNKFSKKQCLRCDTANPKAIFGTKLNHYLIICVKIRRPQLNVLQKPNLVASTRVTSPGRLLLSMPPWKPLRNYLPDK